MDDFLERLLVELRARHYRAEASFEVLATVVSAKGRFGLRFNASPRRRFVACQVAGLEWTPLAERGLGEWCEPTDPEFMSWLIGLIGVPAPDER